MRYLNARYYDPKLGFGGKTLSHSVFRSPSLLQPDWFEVTAAGVGTNRTAYAGGDPVNASDPGGRGFHSPYAGLIP